MILNRFGVRGRLNLLLLLPVAAVLLVATPLVVGQVNDARAATRTAGTAGQVRQVSGLVWELQRELLVTTAYVATPGADPNTVLDQQRAVTDAVEGVRSSLGAAASDELTGALTRVGSLDELRRNAMIRAVSLDSLARTYHAVTEAVIDAFRLLPRGAAGAVGLDAESTKALGELDALLRAGEYSALRGTSLITATGSPAAGRKLLSDATANAQILTQRFVQQADVEQAALLVLVDQGEAGRRVDALSRQLPNSERCGGHDGLRRRRAEQRRGRRPGCDAPYRTGSPPRSPTQPPIVVTPRAAWRSPSASEQSCCSGSSCCSA